jgi:hypothetical protein
MSPDDDRQTGLPLLRTWRAAYWFVLGTFVLWLVLLWALMRRFA